MGGGEAGQGRQRGGEGVDVTARAPARAGEERVAPELAQHAVRRGGVERGGPEGDVREDLDEHAAEPAHHHGTEGRVPLHAEDHLDAAGDHGGDEDPVDVGAGAGRSRGGDDGGEGSDHGLRGVEVEGHAAHVALVRDVG